MTNHTVALKDANANLAYDTSGCFPILIAFEVNVVSAIKTDSFFTHN